MEAAQIERGNGAINKRQNLPAGWSGYYAPPLRRPAEILGMPESFNREWAQQVALLARVDEQVSAIRTAQQERAAKAEEEAKRVAGIEARLTALETAAWSWKKFRESLPQIAAFATLTGALFGLIVYLIKHLSL